MQVTVLLARVRILMLLGDMWTESNLAVQCRTPSKLETNPEEQQKLAEHSNLGPNSTHEAKQAPSAMPRFRVTPKMLGFVPVAHSAGFYNCPD